MPEGQWKIVADEIYLASSSKDYREGLVLVKSQDRTLVEAIFVRTNAEAGVRPGWTGYKLHDDCTRKDLHVVKVHVLEKQGNQDCWTINHVTTDVSSDSQLLAKLREYLRVNAIPMPRTFIRVDFHMATSDRFLLVRHYFNPEAEGFSPSRETRWLNNDWHKNRIASDPKKVSYIEKLREWAEQWHDRVKQGFHY